MAICLPEWYEPKRRVSYLGWTWLDFLQKTENIVIIREVRVDQCFVNGINETEKKVYEFYGGIWHSCKECFPNNRSTILNPYSGIWMKTFFWKFREKRILYKKKIWATMIKLWECKLISMRKRIRIFINFSMKISIIWRIKNLDLYCIQRTLFLKGRHSFKIISQSRLQWKNLLYLFHLIISLCSQKEKIPSWSSN